MSTQQQNPVILRRQFTIGASDAEADRQFLESCFVDTGIIASLKDCNNPYCIAVGRTGAGKTALLQEFVSRTDNAIELAPEALSMSYLTNSTVLTFFESLGVDLDVFYKFLWQHVFAVELIKARYHITDEQKHSDFLYKLAGLLGLQRAKRSAFEYLQQWGSKFWLETSARVKEFTEKLEADLKASVKIDLSTIDLGAAGALKLTEEQKREVTHHGQEIVNKVQIQALHQIIETLADDIFNDPLSPYFIIIDRLDENWVDERIRYKLVRALIEAIRVFRRVRNVKILVSLRTDLLHSVLSRTTQAGFQREKYESLYLHLKWVRDDLTKLLDLRTTHLFKRQYTNSSVQLADILPQNQIERRSATDYIIDRTFSRPREAILFVNECIARADGRSRISIDILRAAENSYSVKRLRSLQDEWENEYPMLTDAAEILNGRSESFPMKSITSDDLQVLAEHIVVKECTRPDPLRQAAEAYFLGTQTAEEFTEKLVCVFYQVGIVGVKLAPQLALQWSYIDEPMLARGQLNGETMVNVHKTFLIALNVTPAHLRSSRAATPAADPVR